MAFINRLYFVHTVFCYVLLSFVRLHSKKTAEVFLYNEKNLHRNNDVRYAETLGLLAFKLLLLKVRRSTGDQLLPNFRPRYCLKS